MRQSEPQSKHEISAYSQLGHSLGFQRLNLMRCRARHSVFLSQLACFIRSPSINLARPREKHGETASAYAEVRKLERGNTLDSVRCEELTEGTTAPEVELPIHALSP